MFEIPFYKGGRGGAFAIAAMILILPLGASTAFAQSSTRPVYAMTNSAQGNAIEIFQRASNGLLTPDHVVSTGGLGLGAGLSSQGSLAITNDNHWLIASNAGSNDVSVFLITPRGLELTDIEPSGGVKPNGLAVRGDLVFVMNAGSSNISGFHLSGGSLTPIGGSHRSFSGPAVKPGQLGFTPDGQFLVLTEQSTNLLTFYRIDGSGNIHGQFSIAAAGETPFGFSFDRRGLMLVSEAFGGAVNGSAVSSYELEPGGAAVISASISTKQTAACWIETSRDGRYAYTANAGSGSVTGYRVGGNGALSLLDQDGITGVTGGGVIDEDFSDDGQFLYVLAGGVNTITTFRINADGSLTNLGSASTVPGSAGLIAR